MIHAATFLLRRTVLDYVACISRSLAWAACVLVPNDQTRLPMLNTLYYHIIHTPMLTEMYNRYIGLHPIGKWPTFQGPPDSVISRFIQLWGIIRSAIGKIGWLTKVSRRFCCWRLTHIFFCEAIMFWHCWHSYSTLVVVQSAMYTPLFLWTSN